MDQTTDLKEPNAFTEPVTFALDNVMNSQPTDAAIPAYDKPASSKFARYTDPRVIDNTSVDISYEVKQIETRFQKLAEKCQGKAGKKQHK
jgi:hypothetical protein